VTEPVIRLDGVTVREGGRLVLDVDELTVARGETLALIGPNGAGKSTLVHVAALLRRPATGSVTILGQTAVSQNAPTLRRHLSIVFQDPLLFDVSVLANAAVGLRFHSWPHQEAERRGRAWLERFGVGHLTSRKARTLSGGEAARVALARAFATEPSILLLDEPFSALDAPTRASLLPALRHSLRDTGAAAVLVTHDRDEAFAFGDRIAVMTGGRIVACGEAAALTAKPPSRQAAILLGIETILSARLTGIGGELACIELQPAGPTVRSRTSLPATSAPGDDVTITLPAGAVRVLQRDDKVPRDWNVMPGNIGAVTLLSLGTRLVVDTPAPIVGIAPWDPGACPWSLGSPAVVAFSPESAHLIPAESPRQPPERDFKGPLYSFEQ
jgi:tungstate transport system ATP-binding protein